MVVMLLVQHLLKLCFGIFSNFFYVFLIYLYCFRRLLIYSGELVIVFLFVFLKDINSLILEVYEVFSQELALFEVKSFTSLVFLGAQEMITFVAVLVHQSSSVINMLNYPAKISIFALILIIMIFKSNNSTLI
jgi:hypothetical protein